MRRGRQPVQDRAVIGVGAFQLRDLDERLDAVVRWVDDSRRSGLAGHGKIEDMNPIELEGGDGNRVAVDLDKASHGQAASARHAAGHGSRPRQRAVGILVTDARVAGGLVEHDGVGASVAIEVAGAEELSRGFGDRGRVSGYGQSQETGERREQSEGFGVRRLRFASSPHSRTLRDAPIHWLREHCSDEIHNAPSGISTSPAGMM